MLSSASTPPMAMGQGLRTDISSAQLISRNISWVYTCANKNATAAAGVKIRLYHANVTGKKRLWQTRRITQSRKSYLQSTMNKSPLLLRTDDVEEVLDHPVLDLIQNVNPFMNQYEWLYLVFASQELVGNSYTWKKRFRSQLPTELWPLLPQFVDPIPDPKKWIKGYKFGHPGKSDKTMLKTQDVLHGKYPSMTSPIMGSGPLQAALMAADLNRAMNIYETSTFRSGGTPDVIMYYDKDATVSEPDIARIERKWKRQFKSPYRQGGMHVATGGVKGIEVIGFKPKEMSFLKGREASLEEIAGCFGVPMSKLVIQDISRANAEAGNMEWMKDTIVPKLIMNQDKLNEDLVAEFDPTMFLAYDNPVPEDTEMRLKEIKERITVGYSTINEERAIDGLEPVDDGDFRQGGEPEPVPATLMAPQDDEKRYKVAAPRLNVPANNFVPEAFIDRLQKYFTSQSHAVLENLTLEDLKSVKEANPGSVVARSFDMSFWKNELATVVTPIMTQVSAIAGSKALLAVGSDLQFEVNAPSTRTALADRVGHIANTINETVAKDLRSVVQDGINAGEGAARIRKRIQGVWFAKTDTGEVTAQIDRIRSANIARTETIWAHNSGVVEGWKQSGVVEAKEWSTAQDERACQWCGPMDGKIISIETNFFGKDDKFEGRDGGILSFDYSEVGHPPLHPQCRCTVLPVVKEL